MIISSRRLLSALIFVVVFVPLFACEKKDMREPRAAADAAEEQAQIYVTTEEVRVRSGPGTRFKIIAEIKNGTKVNVAGREDGWLRVVSKHGNPPGYIDERFAKPASGSAASSAPGLYVTVADAYVREGPGLHYKAVATIETGKEVNVAGGDGEWLKVVSKHGRPPGYIERRHAEPKS
jgi:uncharacterized protein YgiM (DUF1202 family)